MLVLVTGGMILHTVPKKILNIRTKNVPVTAGADATVYVHGFGLYIAHTTLTYTFAFDSTIV